MLTGACKSCIRYMVGFRRDLMNMIHLMLITPQTFGSGEKDLTELELNHLEGYKGSKPVRIGNGAANHLQLVGYRTVNVQIR